MLLKVTEVDTMNPVYIQTQYIILVQTETDKETGLENTALYVSEFDKPICVVETIEFVTSHIAHVDEYHS